MNTSTLWELMATLIKSSEIKYLQVLQFCSISRYFLVCKIHPWHNQFGFRDQFLSIALSLQNNG